MAQQQNMVGSFAYGKARHVDTRGLKQGSDGTVTGVTEVYQVVVSDPSKEISPDSVIALPKKDSKHTTWKTLYVESYSWSHAAPRARLWTCEVVYKRRQTTEASGEDGRTRVLMQEWGHEGGQGEIVSDAGSGAPVVNSAGDPFDSLPTRDETYPCVRYGYAEKTFRPERLWLNNCINNAELTVLGITFPPHTCRLKVSCKRNLQSEDWPYEWTYIFVGRESWVKRSQCVPLGGGDISVDYEEDGLKMNIGWDVALLQCGFQHFDENGDKVKFLVQDANGNPTEPSLPQLLDVDGKALSPTAGGGILALVQAYREADLSGIAPEDE